MNKNYVCSKEIIATKMNKLKIIFIVFSILLLPKISFAYLDPGTGSYIYQLIIAGIVGASYTVKVFWGRIKTFFIKLSSKKSHDGKDNK